MLHAVALWRRNPDALMVMCGAGQENAPSEAGVMASVAVANGMPAAGIILDDRSINTFENIAFGAALISERSIDQLMVVTDGWHMPRTLMCCRALCISVEPHPVPVGDITFSTILHICREIPALLKYGFWLQGRVRSFKSGCT